MRGCAASRRRAQALAQGGSGDKLRAARASFPTQSAWRCGGFDGTPPCCSWSPLLHVGNSRSSCVVVSARAWSLLLHACLGTGFHQQVPRPTAAAASCCCLASRRADKCCFCFCMASRPLPRLLSLLTLPPHLDCCLDHCHVRPSPSPRGCIMHAIY